MAVVTVLLWRGMVRIYSKAQIALEETLSGEPPAVPERPSMALLFKEARLETVAVRAGSPASGKLIWELALRSQTGATIAAIGRDSGNIISPGPDEELAAGDQVLILGNEDQVKAARLLIEAGRSDSTPAFENQRMKKYQRMQRTSILEVFDGRGDVI
jgi:hypothetical protein